MKRFVHVINLVGICITVDASSAIAVVKSSSLINESRPAKSVARSTEENDKKFEDRIVKESERLQQSRWKAESERKNTNLTEAFRPTLIEKRLLHRLQQGLSITDESFLLLVRAWRDCEGFKPSGFYHDLKGHLFPNTQRLAKLFLPIVQSDDAKAQLHEILAYSYEQSDDFVRQVEELAQVQTLLNNLHLSVDKRRSEATLSMAGAVLRTGDKKKADELYSQAFDYPYYAVNDSVYAQYFRDARLRAAQGLIQVRKNNLPALQNIYFEPWLEKELGDELKSAIQSATQKTKSLN